jgi:glycosyltransferase involved in cell wall biosynthesis
MRIAFVTNLAPYYRRPLFRALADEHEIDFYFFSRGSERYVTPQLRHDVSAGFRQETAYRRWTIGSQPFVPDLAWRLRRNRYDAVVKCLNGKLMTPWVVMLARAQGLPLVLWTGMWYHPETVVHQVTAPMTRLLYRQANAIVTYGEHVKRFLVRDQGIAEAKIFVAGQAVDGTVFESAARRRLGQPAPLDAIYVGQLEERKGIRQLLEAFSGVQLAGASLTIVGDGSLRPEVEGHSARDHRISVIGHVTQAELADRLARACCLVVPSITTRTDREPWGLVVNEAMHSGIPVIASTAVGAAAGGLVQHEVNGLIVREGDSEQLRRGLERLLSDTDLARRMGIEAAASVRAFDYPRMVAAFDAALACATGS